MSQPRVAVVPAPTPRGGTPGQGASIPRLDTSTVNPEIGASIDSARQELDDASADVKTFPNRTPDECIRMVIGHFARLSEIRTRIVRVEDHYRQWQQFRQRELEPALKDLQLQWEMASRRHTIRVDEYKIETGER